MPVVSSPRQRAVLILGAGRSGTSVIARATQAVGVELGDHFKPASRKNPSGFFEDTALLSLSKKLRRALDLRPDSLSLLDESVWDSSVVAPFYAEFADTIKARFGAAPIWGFKYARTMRLLPFWVNLFRQMDLEPSYVMPIRNPLSVARSRARLDAHRGSQENSDLEWLVNVVPHFHLLQDSPLVVIDYDRLIANPLVQVQRLAKQLDLPVTVKSREAMDAFVQDFLRPGLQHTQFSIASMMEEKRVNRLLCEAYCLLDCLAVDEMNSSTIALWDRWKEINARLAELRPVLARLDLLGRQLRRAQWNPLSPLPAASRLARKLLDKL